jgi:hypothetical protein
MRPLEQVSSRCCSSSAAASRYRPNVLLKRDAQMRSGSVLNRSRHRMLDPHAPKLQRMECERDLSRTFGTFRWLSHIEPFLLTLP